MADVLVTGSASGLGLALVTEYARSLSTQSTVHALDRNHNVPQQLADLSNVDYHSVDITDESAVDKFAASLQTRGVRFGLVVHSAGVRGLVRTVPISQSSDVASAETLRTMDSSTMRSTFEINALGFFTFIRTILPLLPQSDRGTGVTPKVVVIGSRMGSIGHNVAAGGGYAYRASKAALNAIVRSLSVDVPGVTWTVVHPGRVETGLVPVKESGAISVEEAIRDLCPLIRRLTEADSGRFLDRFGDDVPW